MMDCKSCGAQLKKNYNECRYCGREVPKVKQWQAVPDTRVRPGHSINCRCSTDIFVMPEKPKQPLGRVIRE